MHEDHSAEIGLASELPINAALVIASGGDLAFILAGMGISVTAVDTNPAQIDLVARKMEYAASHTPEECQAVFLGSRKVPGWCFSGKVDRVLRTVGPVLALSYDCRARSLLIAAAFHC